MPRFVDRNKVQAYTQPGREGSPLGFCVEVSATAIPNDPEFSL
jgi:hypothetical protein